MKHWPFIFIVLLMALTFGCYGHVNGQATADTFDSAGNLTQRVWRNANGTTNHTQTLAWNPSRPTGFGAVPDYRPVALANGANLAQASAWRGRWPDLTGYYQIGLRPYDPVSGRWLTFDSTWNERDPNYYTFCGGDPINGFDADGRLGKDIGPSIWDDSLPPQQGDAVDAYNQMEAQMGMFEQYDDAGTISDEQSFSSLVNMIPVVGGLKMWVELGTGNDFFTGQHIQSSDWAQAAMIGLSFLPIAAEAAPEEALIEEQVNIPFAGVNQIGAEGTADAYQYALLKAQYATLENSGPAAGENNYGTLDALGRPTGISATITQDMIGIGTPANSSIIPPGWSGNGTFFNEARGHLLGAQLGGSGDIPENLVTLTQNPANNPVMLEFENSVREAVENSETINYTATPIYVGDNPVPSSIKLSAEGSGGFSSSTIVVNPAGR